MSLALENDRKRGSGEAEVQASLRPVTSGCISDAQIGGQELP